MSANTGINKSQLQLMRMLLAQAEPPRLRTEPVQDVGGGIAQGVGNIVNALLQRKSQAQNQAMLDNLLAQEQAGLEAQAMAEQQRLQKLGLDPSLAGADASTINKVLDINAKDIEAQRLLQQQNSAYEDTLNSVMVANGWSWEDPRQVAMARAFTNEQFYGQRGNPATSGLAAVNKGGLLLDAVNNKLLGGKGLGQLDTNAGGPSLQVGFGAYGIPFADTVSESERRGKAKQAYVAGEYAAPTAQAGLTGQNLANEGKVLSNANQEIKNTNDNLMLGVLQGKINLGQALAARQIGLDDFVRGSLGFSTNPIGDVNTITGNEEMFKGLKKGTLNELGFSPMQAAQQGVQTAAGLAMPSVNVGNMMQTAGNLLNSFQGITPEQGAQLRQQTLNNIGSSLQSGFGGLTNYLRDSGRSSVQNAQALSNLLGIPAPAFTPGFGMFNQQLNPNTGWTVRW